MAKSSKKEAKESSKVIIEEKDVDENTPITEPKPIAISPVAQPMAPSKLSKKILKTVKKASKAKNVKRGVKEVVKGLRKGSKG